MPCICEVSVLTGLAVSACLFRHWQVVGAGDKVEGATTANALATCDALNLYLVMPLELPLARTQGIEFVSKRKCKCRKRGSLDTQHVFEFKPRLDAASL